MKNSVTHYQDYLPAILQSDEFLGRFLLAFEQILSGLQNTSSSPNTQNLIIEKNNLSPLGLEEIIDKIDSFFDAAETPDEFLPWLASWVALSLREDWKPEIKRGFIQEIVPLYQKRGTKTGLQDILKLYLKSAFPEQQSYDIIITEFDDIPYYFQVELTQQLPDFSSYYAVRQIAQAIINQEKPIQTFYALKIPKPVTSYEDYIDLKQACKITIAVTQKPEQVIALNVTFGGYGHESDPPESIKNNAQWQKEYEVTEEQFQNAEEKRWNVTLDNPSDRPAYGNITFALNSSDTPPPNKSFILAPSRDDSG